MVGVIEFEAEDVVGTRRPAERGSAERRGERRPDGPEERPAEAAPGCDEPGEVAAPEPGPEPGPEIDDDEYWLDLPSTD